MADSHLQITTPCGISFQAEESELLPRSPVHYTILPSILRNRLLSLRKSVSEYTLRSHTQSSIIHRGSESLQPSSSTTMDMVVLSQMGPKFAHHGAINRPTLSNPALILLAQAPPSSRPLSANLNTPIPSPKPSPANSTCPPSPTSSAPAHRPNAPRSYSLASYTSPRPSRTKTSLFHHRSRTSNLVLIQPPPSRSLNSNNYALLHTPSRTAVHQIFPRHGL